MVELWFIPSFPSQRQFGKSLWWSSSVTWKQAQVRFKDCCWVYLREKVHLLLGMGFGMGGGGSSVNVLQTVASEQAPGERETAREPLFPPCAAPSSSSLLRSSTRFVCRIFSVLPGIPFTGYTNWGELNLFCSHFFLQGKRFSMSLLLKSTLLILNKHAATSL